MSRYGLTDSGILVDLDKGKAFSPSAGAWVETDLPVAAALDSTAISDSEALALTKDSKSLTEPPKASA